MKLFFPHPHQDLPVLPVDRDGDWFGRWRAMDPKECAVMRTYTVREHREDANELDIDFAVHEPGGGLASRWAMRAAEVCALRRHLVHERGFDRAAVMFTGYWRRGAGEDDLLPEHTSNSADQG